jgi:hypothetical protein
MSKIKKLDLYLSEPQYEKLLILADQKGITPEEAANEVVYSYLAIVDPAAVDYDDMTEEEKEEYDRRYEEWCRSEDSGRVV